MTSTTAATSDTASDTRPAVPAASTTDAAWARRAERWLGYDSRVRQSLIVLAGGAVSLVVLDTADVPGLRALGYTLVALDIVVMAARLAPDAVLDRLLVLPYYVLGGVLAALTVSLDRTGVTLLFGYFLVGNAGFRLPSRGAFAVATGITGACTLALATGGLAGWTPVPWWSGSFMGLVVLIGIANRSRGLALAATTAAAESAVQAARAEARAHTMAERARIARDVHDVLAHSLASISLQLEVVDALLENGDVPAARAATGKAARQVRDGLGEVSRTVHNLREDALPLVDTLGALVTDAAPAGTVLEVVGGRREVPTAVSTALARVAQEGLTNAHKHAPDGRVQVRLTFGEGITELDVVNGPSPGAPRILAATGGGMGLVGMRERVEILGGSVQTGPVVDGQDAGGWRVHAVVPA